VRIKTAAPPADPTFQPFYDHLRSLVRQRRKQDIEALVGPGFFWERDLGDSFDRRKTSVANFRSAVLTIWADFWKGMDAVTRAPTAAPHSQRASVACSPGELPPAEDEKISSAMSAMGAETPYDVLYAGAVAASVRVQPREDAELVTGLQNELVPLNVNAETKEMLKRGYRSIRLFDGRPGYVRQDEMFSLIDARLCFSKTTAGWRIVGFVGGGD
jgi:hypothetical protein